MGVVPHMAPELWKLKSPAVKTDLYALGCLGYELLADTPPYTGGDQAALRAGHLTQAPPDAPCGDAVLKSLVGRLIAKRPEDRPQDAPAVLDRLRRALGSRLAWAPESDTTMDRHRRLSWLSPTAAF